jgi:hypothetical protein
MKRKLGNSNVTGKRIRSLDDTWYPSELKKFKSLIHSYLHPFECCALTRKKRYKTYDVIPGDHPSGFIGPCTFSFSYAIWLGVYSNDCISFTCPHNLSLQPIQLNFDFVQEAEKVYKLANKEKKKKENRENKEKEKKEESSTSDNSDEDNSDIDEDEDEDMEFAIHTVEVLNNDEILILYTGVGWLEYSTIRLRLQDVKFIGWNCSWKATDTVCEPLVKTEISCIVLDSHDKISDVNQMMTRLQWQGNNNLTLCKRWSMNRRGCYDISQINSQINSNTIWALMDARPRSRDADTDLIRLSTQQVRVRKEKKKEKGRGRGKGTKKTFLQSYDLERHPLPMNHHSLLRASLDKHIMLQVGTQVWIRIDSGGDTRPIKINVYNKDGTFDRDIRFPTKKDEGSAIDWCLIYNNHHQPMIWMIQEGCESGWGYVNRNQLFVIEDIFLQ